MALVKDSRCHNSSNFQAQLLLAPSTTPGKLLTSKCIICGNSTCSKILEIHRFPSEALVNKSPHNIYQYNFYSHLHQHWGSKSDYLCFPFIISITIVMYNFTVVAIIIVLIKKIISPYFMIELGLLILLSFQN